MPPGPSKIAEAIVAVFVPRACREEVLGDLHERYRSSRQYALDAVRTVPLVVISRIRRTGDPLVLLIQACVWYLSFLAGAWVRDRAFLSEPWGLLRLAIPAGIAMLGLILADAYAKPGLRPSVSQSRSPALGALLALLSQEVQRISDPAFAVPSSITIFGFWLGLYSCCIVRGLLPPAAAQTQYLQGAHVPVDWLKQQAERAEARGLTLIWALMLVLVIALQVLQ